MTSQRFSRQKLIPKTIHIINVNEVNNFLMKIGEKVELKNYSDYLYKNFDQLERLI